MSTSIITGTGMRHSNTNIRTKPTTTTMSTNMSTGIITNTGMTIIIRTCTAIWRT